MTEAPSLPEIAFYYPNPIWRNSNWVKNLILFFDGVGLLVPEYMKDRPRALDPAIVTGLEQHHLLHILEPEKLVDKAATGQLALAMTEIITSGALDALSGQDTAFQELSYSRLGGYGDEGLARMIFDELKLRGLAQETKDGVSIPLHPVVRSLVLVLLAQILKSKGTEIGPHLNPATDRPKLVEALGDLLSLPNNPSPGNVVSFDLTTVGVDLSSVPIDEILAFRADNYDSYLEYRRTVRDFLSELSQLDPAERALAFEERQGIIDGLAVRLRQRSRSAWKRPAAFALSIAGAVWTLHTGDLLGGVFAGATALVGAGSGQDQQANAYSYLFNAGPDLL